MVPTARTASRSCLVAGLLGWAGLAGYADAQQRHVIVERKLSSPIVQVQHVDGGEAIAAPANAPAATVEGLTLEGCIQMAYAKQPALAAARASLAAAVDARQALDNLRFAAILSKDIPVRRQQACIGVSVAEAKLLQAEWETRYAVTRNFYTIQYVRLQQTVVNDALAKMERGRKTAERLVRIGAVDGVPKVTNIDVDTIKINIELLQAKATELTTGIEKARSALREAIGVGPDCPLWLLPEPLPAIVPALHKEALIAAALAQRGEVAQANGGNQIVNLEVDAQQRKRGIQVPTFAAGSDIHATPVPQGISNKEYRPGALGIEMPVFLVGRKNDRVQRASDLTGRSGAVVDKTTNLVALEVENYYLNWQEAKEKVERLGPILKSSEDVGQRVETRFSEGNATGEEYLRAATLGDQVRAQYNEAIYLHALAVAALERATAGAFRIPHGTVAATTTTLPQP